jgi:hypothetical protein
MMKLGHDIYFRIDVVFFFSPFKPIPDTLSLFQQQRPYHWA